MNEEPLDEQYFEWLAGQVVNLRLRNPTQTSWSVLRKLFSTQFLWRIRNDDNRAEDGKELRREFLDIYPQDVVSSWMNEKCSFLEMLIALSRRLSFQTEGASSAEWFWHLLDNVGLYVSDREFDSQGMDTYARQVLEGLNNRTYDRNGRGGLFPLTDSDIDQTTIELWYQMNYYLLERSQT